MNQEDIFDTHAQIPAPPAKRQQNRYPSNSVINAGTVVPHGSAIGDSVVILGGVRLGDGVTIGTNVRINSKVIAGNALTVGAGAVISTEFTAGNRLYLSSGARIGDNATIGEHASFGRVSFGRELKLGAQAEFGRGCVFPDRARVLYAGRRAHAVLTLNDITGRACTFTVVPHTKGLYVEWGNLSGEADDVFSNTDLADDATAVALGKALANQVKMMLYSYKKTGGW